MPRLAAPRMARFIALIAFCGFVVVAVLNIMSLGHGAAELWASLPCVAAAFTLHLVHMTPDAHERPTARRVLTLSAQAVATYLPLLWLGEPWGSMTAFLAGSSLLLLPGWGGWMVFGTVVAGQGLLSLLYGHSALWTSYLVVSGLLTGLIVYGMSRLSSSVAQVEVTRGELARLAVMRERLRVARDLHDLLGFSLSAITLKSELMYRLLPRSPERARVEVAEMLAVSRQALADVRLVASGFREMSLEAEADSARSVLEVADIRVETRVRAAGLPGRLDTVLATVLREAVTNILRHSRAQWCEVRLRERAGVVRLEITNDGVPSGDTPGDVTVAAPREGGGSGLGNLTTRLAQVGGVLSAGPGDDGCFRLTVEAPLVRPGREDGQTARLSRGDPAEAPDLLTGAPEYAISDASAPRLAWSVTQVVFGGFLLMTMLNVLAAGAPAPVLGVLAAVVLTLQLFHSSVTARPWPRPLVVVTLCVQALLTYVPLLWFDWGWDAVAGFLAGCLLLLVDGRLGWALCGAVVLSMVPVTRLQGLGAIDSVYTVVTTVLTGTVVYGMSRLSASVIEVRSSRGELARLAVMRERLRVARDLHDLLGFSLSAITLKSELMYRLLPRSPERARVEVAEMLAVSRQALADVRLVASGFREMSLEAEADSARSVLGAAGMEVELVLEVRAGGLPGRLDTVLATVLREAVTNILRHSRAQWCEVRLRERAGVVRLEITNDGVVAGPEAAPALDALDENGSSGLEDLTARLAQVGGVLRAGPEDDDRFRLTAEAPAQPPAGEDLEPGTGDLYVVS